MKIDDTVIDRERRIRRGIMRTALWTTPLFVGVTAAWVFFLWDRITGPEYGSTWFLMVVITVFAALFGVQSTSALRDLLGKPREETGQVLRKWSKRDSFVWKSWYIRVGRRILRGEDDVLRDINAGDIVQLRFFPHSSLVIAAERVEKEEPEEPELEPLPEEPARPRGAAARPEF
jgi:hypothetical protein